MMRWMRIVSRAVLVAFYSRPEYADSREAIEAWWDVARHAAWAGPADVKAQYRHASIVGNNRAVFNIKGNDYRLIVAFAYRTQRGYVKFIGTHAQYDKVDAATVDLSKE
jgi:mRNA interferase HigB